MRWDRAVDPSDALAGTDPKASAEAARTAAAHLRRAGARNYLGFALANLAQALVMTGDWDAADAELARAADADGLAEAEFLALFCGWLAALRGDAKAALDTLAALPGLLASEDLQDQANVDLVRAFSSIAAGQLVEALGHARNVLARAETLGISADTIRWAWPVAARAAHHLADTAASSELLRQVDTVQPGHLAPMLRAERDLVRARLADRDASQAAAFAAAIRALREHSTPYHLAHGLLDHAEYLSGAGTDAPDTAIREAHEIAERLRCQPLLDRAARLAGTPTRVMAS